MKKLLLSIFGLFLGLSAFCSAGSFVGSSFSCYLGNPISGYDECSDELLYFGPNGDSQFYSGTYILTVSTTNSLNFNYYYYFSPNLNGASFAFVGVPNVGIVFECSDVHPCREANFYSFENVSGDGLVTFSIIPYLGGSSSSDITVYYDYGHSSATISCNGDNSIFINSMSYYSGFTFSPYFNINYTDEDNQNVIESYSKDLLYLVGGQYHKTYTGDNQWILNLVGGSSNTGGFNIISSGLVVSGDIVSDNLSGNMFKSFIDTGFTVLFSNVPSYIQYVILIVILIVILRAFTKKRKKF